MRYLLLIALILSIMGCATKQDAQYAQWAAIEEKRQARLDALAASCTSDLCVVMVAQEANRNANPLPRTQTHPGWALLDRALGIAVPAYFGYRQSEAWAGALVGVTQSITSMDNAYTDNSVSIGGDSIGGNRVDDYSVQVGHDQIGQDRINDSSVGGDSVGRDQRHGDDIRLTDTCVGESCYSQSPGPVDNSNTDNSSQFPL